MRSHIQLLRSLQIWGHAVVEHLRSELDEVHVYHIHMLKRRPELVSKLSRDGLNSAWSMAKAIVDSTVTCPPRAQTAPVSSSRQEGHRAVPLPQRSRQPSQLAPPFSAVQMPTVILTSTPWVLLSQRQRPCYDATIHHPHDGTTKGQDRMPAHRGLNQKHMGTQIRQ